MNKIISTVITIVICTAFCIAVQAQATTGTAQDSDKPLIIGVNLHMHGCYMPNNTLEYHLFEYTTAPTYDLCTEIGGRAY